VVSLVSLMKASPRFPCVASSSDTWTPSAASALISDAARSPYPWPSRSGLFCAPPYEGWWLVTNSPSWAAFDLGHRGRGQRGVSVKHSLQYGARLVTY